MRTNNMKSKHPQEGNKKSGWPSSRVRRLSARPVGLLAVVVTGLWLVAFVAKADNGNQLVNPGWENANTGWTMNGNCPTYSTGATYYNGNSACGDDPVAETMNIYDGNGIAQIWGGNYGVPSYWQQTFVTVPGTTWSASVFAYTSHEDIMTNKNFCVDVAFLDTNQNVLAEYQSGNFTNIACGGAVVDTWVFLPVTNQVAIGTGTVIATVPSGVFTAPAGTAQVRYRDDFTDYNGGGSVFLDDADLDEVSGPVAPVISNLTPDYIYRCTNASLTFTASSVSGIITNVQVIATMTGLPGSGSGTNTVTYIPGSAGLTIAGLDTPTATVSLALASNTLYTVTVGITDNNNLTTSAADIFDTVQAILEWEAADFNFNSGDWPTNGGMFACANEVGTADVDELVNGSGHAGGPYRPGDAVNFQTLGETLPNGVGYTPQNFVNYWAANPGTQANNNFVPLCVGWNSVGDWLNYTRNFPAGTYNVYARIASGGNGPQCRLSQVASDPTQSPQTVTNLGTFSSQGLGWGTCSYCPLLDNFGNLVPVKLDGTQTLQVTIIQGGNPNLCNYMVVPAAVLQNPVLQSSYPTGVHPFEPTNHFTFVVGQAGGSPISAGNVHLVLNGTDVTSQVSFTSTATNWTGTVPIVSNAVYSALINATNSTHLSSAFSINFDTFTQSNYTWEASDWDFDYGQFIDNPIPTADDTFAAGPIANGTLETNSYFWYPGGTYGSTVGVEGVDMHNLQNNPPTQYRADVFGTQVANDWLRQKFIDAQVALSDPNIAEFNIGYYNPGMWANYTRHYPAGNYNVWARIAQGGTNYSGALLSVITGGWGTTLQSSNVLGTFSSTNHPNGWQNYAWTPLTDVNGNLARVSFNGSTNTLNLTCATNSSINVTFLMLVPAALPGTPTGLSIKQTGTQLGISFNTQTGYNYTVQYTASLSAPVVWSTLTTLSGNGSPQTATDSLSGQARFYRVFAQ